MVNSNVLHMTKPKTENKKMFSFFIYLILQLLQENTVVELNKITNRSLDMK